MIDNTIRTRSGSSTPAVRISNFGVYYADFFSSGNTFTISNWLSFDSQLLFRNRSIGDQVIPFASINATAPVLPGNDLSDLTSQISNPL